MRLKNHTTPITMEYLLIMYSIELQKNGEMYTLTFIVELFTIAKRWKQLKCHSMDK